MGKRGVVDVQKGLEEGVELRREPSDRHAGCQKVVFFNVFRKFAGGPD